jgi:hypothetical protein
MDQILKRMARTSHILEECEIPIHSTIIDEALALQAKMEAFCEANKVLIQQKQEQKKKKEAERAIELTIRTVTMELWVVFFFGLLRQIEEEHFELIKDWHLREEYIHRSTLEIDAKKKLFEILQLIRKDWPHPIPPYERVIISKGFLTEGAVLSDYAREKCDWVVLENPVFGFRTPPRLTSLELPTFQDYLTYRNRILVEPRWTTNDTLMMIYCFDKCVPSEFDLFQENISSKTFLELEQFPWFRFSFDPETSVYESDWKRNGWYFPSQIDSGFDPSSLIDEELFDEGLYD